ncbi:MAG TPA: nucleotidyltransferase family protein [Candidatus Acidoferrales bacterium]|nr:nucleotidyltransferase family protein [Candidatus Acidoferrales bacterium]
MKAMVLAAGLGTRLRPLTNDRPKALVELNGRTLLDITLARLREFGVREVIVNVHHFADLVIEHLRAHSNFGMHVEVSREEVLLDTGGGLKKAAEFFLRDGSDEPFILHNVDVLSTIDFDAMTHQHCERGALATLAVQCRDSSRQLMFDSDGLLCGRRNGRDAAPEMIRRCASALDSAFSGIHVISPRIFSLISESGVFPIIPVYLNLAAAGEKICAFRAEHYYWRDLGTAASLQLASHDVKNGLIPLGSER